MQNTIDSISNTNIFSLRFYVNIGSTVLDCKLNNGICQSNNRCCVLFIVTFVLVFVVALIKSYLNQILTNTCGKSISLFIFLNQVTFFCLMNVKSSP